jgi:hypothetical protein
MEGSDPMQARLILGAALVATALLYWIGLHGPFMLDDPQNLEPIKQWLAGQASWQSVLLDNRSGLLGRSVSMASFMLTSSAWGFNPFAFKLGNLIVHLACGLLGWQVLRRSLAQDARLAPHADFTASLLVAIWLLHPINVSTVLYAVQRMAQLSTLFVLASLCAYLAARQQLLAGKLRSALINLFLAFPLLVLAGLLSKENAAVAPALCLVLELAYFAGRGGSRRIIPAFFGAFLLLPLLAAALVLVSEPGRLGTYAGRDFTMGQRLLSEGRALVDYIGVMLFPRSPKLGLFTDDFATSTGLLSPPGTLWCWLALAAMSVFAAAMRRRAPSVFAGWFFFLVAHSIESSVLPLELYFEHRNYLPAFGLWLSLAGLCEFATRNVRTTTLSHKQLGAVVASGFILVFAFGTHGRARVWQSEQAIYAQALEAHPNSLRAILANASVGLNTGDTQMAYDAAYRLLKSPDPRKQMLGHLTRVTYDCISGIGANPSDLRQAVALAQPKLMIAEAHAFELLEGLGPETNCGAVGPGILADAAASVVDAATAQSDTRPAKWRMRLMAARLFGRADRWQEALQQAKLSWQPNADPAAGGFLSRAYAQNGMMEEAERAYAETKARTSPYNRDDLAGLASLRIFLNHRSPGVTLPPDTSSRHGP